MSEYTPNELGQLAEHYVVAHKGAVNRAEEVKIFAEAAILEEEKGHHELPKGRVQEIVDISRNDVVKSVENAAQFARENEEGLHDLAVIEAHLGGVAINVEQPIVVGQKVEVRNLDSPTMETEIDDLDREEDDADIDELREES